MRTVHKEFKYVVDLTDEQIQFAKDCSAKARISERQQGFNGGRDKQFVGFLGEVVFADIMGLDRPEVRHFDDGGMDFEIGDKIIDVKTMLFSKPSGWGYSNDLNDYQFQRSALKTNVYVFAKVIKSTKQIEFTGWIKKWEIKKEWFRVKGQVLPRPGWDFTVSADMYEIPNSALTDFHPHTFISEMQMFGAI